VHAKHVFYHCYIPSPIYFLYHKWYISTIPFTTFTQVFFYLKSFVLNTVTIIQISDSQTLIPPRPAASVSISPGMNQKLLMSGAQQPVLSLALQVILMHILVWESPVCMFHIPRVFMFFLSNKLFLNTSPKTVLCDRNVTSFCCVWAFSLTLSTREEWTLRNSL
jgi:hypothetical protein